MARSDETMEIFHNGRFEDRVSAQPDEDAARRALRGWLRTERWPEDRWAEFTIKIPGAFGGKEVMA
jgi:hypothetical protein